MGNLSVRSFVQFGSNKDFVCQSLQEYSRRCRNVSGVEQEFACDMVSVPSRSFGVESV